MITGLLGSDNQPGRMTYGQRRLRLVGLIQRLPYGNRDALTDDDVRISSSTAPPGRRTLISNGMCRHGLAWFRSQSGRRSRTAVNCWMLPQGVTWSSPLVASSSYVGNSAASSWWV